MTTREEWIEVTRIDRGHRPTRESLRSSSIVAVRDLEAGGVHGTLIVFDGGASVLVAEPLDRMRTLLGLGAA